MSFIKTGKRDVNRENTTELREGATRVCVEAEAHSRRYVTHDVTVCVTHCVAEAGHAACVT